MVKRLRKLIPLATAAAYLALPTAAALAAENLVPSTIAPINNIVTVIRGIIRLILLIAFVAAFLMLIIGGVRWILAGGDEKAVAGARGMITAALIGLVIVLVAYAIIRLVEIFFNVTIITGTVNIPVFNQGQ